MSTLRIDADTEFHRYVERLLTTTPVPGSSWSEDHATLRFLKRKATGYDIEVGYWPSNGNLWLATDRGYHLTSTATMTARLRSAWWCRQFPAPLRVAAAAHADVGSQGAAMSDDGLIVARAFLLKGMPWDLSRPRFMDFQRGHITEKTAADPMFPSRLRHVALEALERDDPEVVCRALTSLAFVGIRDDLPIIEGLATDNDSKISRFARTCMFEITKRRRAT